MRPSSKVASSRPTVKMTHGVPGSASGQRCEYSSRAWSSVVSGPGRPPRSGMRSRPAVWLAAITIDPSAAHVAPRGLPPTSATSSTGPPPTGTLASLRSVKNATQRPSAEKNGWRAPSVPGSAAQRGIAQLAHVEPPHAAFGRLDGQQRARRVRGRTAPRTRCRRSIGAGSSRLRRDGQRRRRCSRGRSEDERRAATAATSAAAASVQRQRPAGAGRAATTPLPLGVLLQVDELDAGVADVLQAGARIAAQAAPDQPRHAARARPPAARSSPARRAARRRRPRRRSGPANTGRAVSISKSTQPNAQTSVRVSTSPPVTCSGLM